MNVNDQWMLERMQQMAANMAASSLPQTGQNTEAPKTEKGESFKDMMDKAKDQKVEAPKKAETPKKTETPQKAENVQKTEPRKVEAAKNADGTETKTVELSAEQAAMLAAGYAKLIPSPESDMMLFVTVQDENGGLILPLKALEDDNYAFSGMIVDDEAQWTMEPTPELAKALEQLLQKTDDPRPMDAILSKLTGSEDGAPIEKAMQVVIRAPEPEEAGEEDLSDLTGELLTEKPLFHDVKAAPVKVGENFQLNTEEPDMDAQLANTIQQAAQQGLRQIEIKLSPENLGELTIKLTENSDGVLHVVLHTDNAKAANLLNQHLNSLNLVLQSLNQNEVRVEVQRSENSEQAQQQQTNPDGHNQQQQQQRQRQQDDSHSGDFLQKLRLGLFGLEDGV